MFFVGVLQCIYLLYVIQCIFSFFGWLIFAVYWKPVQTFGMAHWVVFFPSLISIFFIGKPANWERLRFPARTGVGCFSNIPQQSPVMGMASREAINFPPNQANFRSQSANFRSQSANFRSQQFGGSTILLQLFVVPQHTPNTKGRPPQYFKMQFATIGSLGICSNIYFLLPKNSPISPFLPNRIHIDKKIHLVYQ